MKTPKNIFTLLLCINSLAIILLFGHNFNQFDNRNLQINHTINESLETSLHFRDPVMAYKILSALDVFEPIDLGLSAKRTKMYYTQGPFLGLQTDDNYCDKHRAFFVFNPEVILQRKNFIMSGHLGSKLRHQILPEIGANDTMPHVRGSMKNSFVDKQLFEIRLDTQIFVMSSVFFREVGRHYSCLTQVSNHIPGHDDLYIKDRATMAMLRYKQKYGSEPQCFDTNYHFPPTWSLNNKQQCQEFFEEFNSPSYQKLKQERKIVYFRKIGEGAHQGSGVFPVDDIEEVKIRNQYKNGTLCGQVYSNTLMQYYIHNPLLINGHKADLRMFVIVASTNPLIAYYSDGYLTISLAKFDANSSVKGAFVTNSDVAKKLLLDSQKNGMYQGMTEKDLWEQTLWTYESFQRYLLEEGIITDPNWLDNYLRPSLKKMALHLIRMAQPKFAKISSVYEIYGVDLVLDDELNIWFIEANVNPDLEDYPQEIDNTLKNLLKNTLEVQFGLLRSRTRRIINYINELISTGNAWQGREGEIYLQDLKSKQMEFKNITRNYFEPEFEPAPKQDFPKIIDENLSGTGVYFGVISSQCL